MFILIGTFKIAATPIKVVVGEGADYAANILSQTNQVFPLGNRGINYFSPINQVPLQGTGA